MVRLLFQNPMWAMLLVSTVLVGATGCSSMDFRAATLPDHLRVAETPKTNDINLQSMAGLGSGSTKVGPGDLVEVTIASGIGEEPPEPMLARVSQEGSLELPLIGSVHVAGMEPYEAGQSIAIASVNRGIYRQPAAVLRIEEQASNRVTVIGAVQKPGSHSLPRGSSDVLSAIAAAGGFNKESSTHIEVLRQGSSTFLASTPDANGNVTPVSYNEPAFSPPSLESVLGEVRSDQIMPSNTRTYRLDLAQANPSRRPDYHVDDGDVVMVLPEKKRFIHVTGLVKRPDQFEIETNHDIRLLDAIALAGGIRSPVADKVHIIRRLDDMPEPIVIEASIADAKKNGDENLVLASGDLVSVESTVLTNTVDIVTEFFHITMGLGGNITTF